MVILHVLTPNVQMIKLIDIGANLTDPVFRGLYHGKQTHCDDFSHVLQRATKASVEKIIVTGGSVSESREALAIARNHENLYSTVGCHPTRCREFEEHKGGPEKYFEELVNLAISESAKGKVVAVGECGLDYDRLQFCPKEIQLKYFEKQFDLAQATGLPMFLHNRNTGSDFFNILSIQKNRGKFSAGVVHSFTGTMEEMERAVSLGLYIGVNGCSLKTPENLEVVKRIPEEKILLETGNYKKNAPWCDLRATHASYSHWSSMPKQKLDLYQPSSRKKEKFELGMMVKSRNEPCSIGQVLHVVSSVRGIDPQVIAERIYENTIKVFFQ
ncbi:hypothetical protein G9A89_021780 [Geosiphon pyriformis]|nr:hypothetical protein G9A89_021780 [Geosiphon pyriformis]